MRKRWRLVILVIRMQGRNGLYNTLFLHRMERPPCAEEDARCSRCTRPKANKAQCVIGIIMLDAQEVGAAPYQ